MHLYFKINNKWVEPEYNTESTEPVSLNFSFDNLENPTDYVSEYSYNISLPKTAKNNKLFDEYKQIDSTVKYQPTERIDYIYISNGDTISNGEAYLTGISESNYEFALNGSLYTIFNKLLNSGWDEKRNDEDYYKLNEIWGGGLTITPSIVSQSFNTDNTTFDFDVVKRIRFNAEKFVEIAGFMQTTQKELKDFDTDKWLYNNEILPIGDYDTSTQNNIHSGSLNEQQMCEWRCYKLRPYIYVLRLWQIFNDMCKTITGYDLILDSRWFNENFEYLKGLVYTLPMMDTENVDASNQYVQTLQTATIGRNWNIWTNYNANIISPYTITCSGANKAIYEWSLPLQFHMNGGWGIDARQNHWIFNPSQFIYLEAKVTNGTTDYISKRYIYVPLPSYKKDNGQDYMYNIDAATLAIYRTLCDEVLVYRYETEQTTINSQGNLETTLKFGDVNGKIQLENVDNAHLELNFSVGHGSDACPIKILHHYHNMWGTEKVEINDISGGIDGGFTSDTLSENTLLYLNGSNTKLTMGKLMGDVSPFSILLKFTKMFGILWVVDDNNKQINVIRRSDYFWDSFHRDMSQKSPSIFPYIGYYDITELTDMSTYKIEPLAWTTRNVCFNEESEQKTAKAYKDKYGIGYGSKLVKTSNKINNDTEMLFSKTDNNNIKPCIFSAEYVTPLNVILQRGTAKRQDDNYLIDDDGVFCYRVENGTYAASQRHGYRVDNDGAYVLITGDTQKEIADGTYCWHYNNLENDVKTYVRPVFSECNGNRYSVLFGEPYELYSTNFPSSKSVKFVYEECWGDYVKEVYNPDNKTLIVKAHISGQLYNRLKICPFVVLGNIGYLVIKINNWNDENLTELKLRQITSLKTLYNKSKSKNTSNIQLNVEGAEINEDKEVEFFIGGIKRI